MNLAPNITSAPAHPPLRLVLRQGTPRRRPVSSPWPFAPGGEARARILRNLSAAARHFGCDSLRTAPLRMALHIAASIRAVGNLSAAEMADVHEGLLPDVASIALLVSADGGGGYGLTAALLADAASIAARVAEFRGPR